MASVTFSFWGLMLISTPNSLAIFLLTSEGSERITLAPPAFLRIAQAANPIGPPPKITTLSPGLIPPPRSITAL